MKKLGHYNLIQTESGFHSTLCAGNNKVILTSCSIEKTLSEARIDMDMLFSMNHFRLFFDRRVSVDKKHYFCVSFVSEISGNTEDIYKSETYNSKFSMEKGIQSVTNNAKTTDVRTVDRRKKS